MRRLFVDTGAWYALVDGKDPDHRAAATFIKSNDIPLLTTNFIFDETVTLLKRRLGWTIAVQFGKRLRDSRLTTLVAVRPEIEERAWELFLKFKDQEFTFTDCTSFATMESLKIKAAFSFDSRFQTMQYQVLPENA
jgi:hypothetical protein